MTTIYSFNTQYFEQWHAHTLCERKKKHVQGNYMNEHMRLICEPYIYGSGNNSTMAVDWYS